MVLQDKFFWGNSTSSMQTEGDANGSGKGPSVYDRAESSAIWQSAIDDYHRYPEDIAIMQDLGMNMYRFQISWSRVQPDGEGDFNEAGIAFYAQLIDQLLAAGITPMICLYHFDMPLALAEKYDGFMDRHVVDAFARYAHEMLSRFADKVPYWITFNEQNLYSMAGANVIAGKLTPGLSLRETYQIQHHVALAHALVAQDVHQHFPQAKIGGMVAYQLAYPATPLPEDAMIARQLKVYLDDNVVSLMQGTGYLPEVWGFMQAHQLTDLVTAHDLELLADVPADFMSFSYYQSVVVSARQVPIGTAPNNLGVGIVPNPTLRANQWQWQIDPLGFRSALVDLYNQTNLPVFPIENGIGVDEDGTHGMIQDDYRIAYHREHLQALKDAVELDQVPVLGYLGWGLIDIPSSQGNMAKRYGVVYVNRTQDDVRDLARQPKQSYAWLKQVIQTNGREL